MNYPKWKNRQRQLNETIEVNISKEMMEVQRNYEMRKANKDVTKR